MSLSGELRPGSASCREPSARLSFPNVRHTQRASLGGFAHGLKMKKTVPNECAALREVKVHLQGDALIKAAAASDRNDVNLCRV